MNGKAERTKWKKWPVIVATLVLCIGICTQAFAAAPYAPVYTTNNNFTATDPTGAAVGGTNDVTFVWDGTVKTSVAASGQVANATIASTCTTATPTVWKAHDVAVYGPGTYTVYAGCAAKAPNCTGTARTNPITFTVGADEIGVHALLDIGAGTLPAASKNVDVVNVWTKNSVFTPSTQYTGACGSNSSSTVWDMMSRPTPTVNGYPMVDGPQVGTSVNFNMMGGALNRVVDTTLNNFTMNQPTSSAGPGDAFGGTNDVRFTWDGTKKTSVALSGQVSNGSISSSCAFFGFPWWAHDVAIYGPGTYTVYTGCAAGSPGCGTGTPYTFTVKPGEIAGHMLFLWNNNDNIDVVDVWRQGSFDQGYDATCPYVSVMWDGSLTGGCLTKDPATVWDHMSYDWNGDCVNGADMADGPFAGMNANFNLMGFVPCASDADCDVSLCSPGTCDTGTGRCTYTPKVCNDNNPCTDDSCDSATGLCVYTNNTAVCDDNNACTSGDVCSGGTCQPGSAVVCNDNNLCTTDTCNTASGCVYTPVICVTPGYTCDPADGTCKACTSSSQCNDNNVCTDDSCNTATGACVNSNNTAACNDNNACTTNDICSSGSCAGTPKNCDDNVPCTTDSCSNGVCIHTPNNTSCNDNDACTTDTCNTSTGCVYTPISCDDNNVCTTDTCANGCVFTNNTGPCSDNNACTGTISLPDACSGGICQSGGAVVCATGPACDSVNGCNLCFDEATRCNDNNPCTTDTCVADTGACVNTPNTIACDDGNPCTTGDICSNGACQPGTSALNCDDGNACTDDSCNSATGCVHTGIPGCVNDNPPTTPTLDYPSNGQTDLGTTVQFRWTKSTDADNDPITYKIYYCTTPDATNCTPVTVAKRNSNNVFYAGGAGLLMFGMTFFGGFTGRKRIVLLLLIVVLFTGGTLISCSKSSDKAENWPLPADQMNYTAFDLKAGTTYYWKVVADDGKSGGTTASAVQSFKTL